MAASISSIDEQLCSPLFFAEGDYYGLFNQLRRESPIKWTVGPNGHGFWSLFRHADVKHVLNTPELFSSEREGVMPLMDDQIDEVAEEAFGVGDNILTIDPPRHAHFCLGGPLAKDELRVAIEQLLSRYEGIEITGPIERVQSNFIGGIKRMPMKLRRRASA